jgi:hypothetical protein
MCDGGWGMIDLLKFIATAVVVALKFTLPIFLVPFPFLAGWANFVLDSIDGDILIPLGLEDRVYQLIDKSADWVTYVFMVIAGRHWPIRRWLLGLFVFRSVGQGLFFLTATRACSSSSRTSLNRCSWLYATVRVWKRDAAPAFYRRHWLAIWLIVIVYKMQDEWITHMANIDRTELIKRLFS